MGTPYYFRENGDNASTRQRTGAGERAPTQLTSKVSRILIFLNLTESAQCPGQ